MPTHAEDSSPDPVGRLTTMGLPPRSAGWVPEQPAELVAPQPVPDDVRFDSPFEMSPSPAVAPSRLDVMRLAIADRAPARIADRLRLMSSSSFGAALVVALVAAVAIGVVIHDRRHQSYSDSYSTSASTEPATDDSASSVPAGDAADGSSIVVDVGGQVRHPGLVTLPLGARVDDAIKAAGGPLHPRELARIDLAARVTDGELLLVGGKPSDGGGAASSGGLVDLSTASLTKLETLPGVGPVTAGKIVDWRNAHGGFTSVAQLQEVPGIGPTRYAELSPLVAP